MVPLNKCFLDIPKIPNFRPISPLRGCEMIINFLPWIDLVICSEKFKKKLNRIYIDLPSINECELTYLPNSKFSKKILKNLIEYLISKNHTLLIHHLKCELIEIQNNYELLFVDSFYYLGIWFDNYGILNLQTINF